MKAYSVDLRQKIVDAVLSGRPKAQVARSFGVGISTVKRYVSKAQNGESLVPKRPPGKRRKLDARPSRAYSSTTSKNDQQRPFPKGASSFSGYPALR